MRTVLIENPDTKHNLDHQIKLVCPEVRIEGKSTSISNGIELVEARSPHFIFLDTHLEDGTAMDLLYKFKKRKFGIILTHQAEFENKHHSPLSVDDHLFKPIPDQKLKEAITRVNKVVGAQKLQEQYQKIIHQPHMKRLAIPTCNGLNFVFTNEVVFVEASGSYTEFHLVNGERIISSTGLKCFETLLEQFGFIRIHNSHIVNMNFVSQYHKGRGGAVELIDGRELLVSQRRKDVFLGNLLKP